MSYEIFASFYDRLTENVNYKAYAEYIKKAFDKYSEIKIETVLDLACGTGTLTLELCNLGFDMIGADSSSSMLSIAQNKMFESGKRILYLCQSMQEIDLYGTVDAVVCTLDSINHVESESTVKNILKKISLFMNKGGIFLFDVNTLYKHREILADNAFVYDVEDVFCVWQNFFDESDLSVEIDLDFFEKRENIYRRYTESFKEYYYPREKLCKWLKSAGFEVLGIFGEMTFDEPCEDTQRIVYIARKK